MGDVYANGRSILHKGDGNTHISAPPDVCKVPTPGGPVPTPFVNSAQDSMLAKGSTTTTIEGNPIVLSSSELSTSSGDEPGTAGGLISSKFKGKMTWSGSSTDVKVEGKGVARFLDPTMHNGNTFNVCFISRGGTGLAYGDDAKCPACGQAGRKHRVLETPEIKGNVGLIFQGLDKRIEPQRPLIAEHQRLMDERTQITKRSDWEANVDSRPLVPKQVERQGLIDRLKVLKKQGLTDEQAPVKAALDRVQNEIGAINDKIKARRKRYAAQIQALTNRMAEINQQLDKMGPVLRLDEVDDTFSRGYMVGACICKCKGKPPKMLAACSGDATDRFKEAVSDAGFTHVAGFQMSSRQQQYLQKVKRSQWTCAAPQLLHSGGADGHRVKVMSERFYSPAKKGSKVTVRYERSEYRTRTRKVEEGFGHGESVPSCKECQKLLPEMLCYNHLECP